LFSNSGLVAGRSSRADGLHGDGVGVPGTLGMGLLFNGGRLEEVEVEHREIGYCRVVEL
jgi:hypothetical protein